jgi:UDP-GlcNAc:undecaprenyl-phosphate GlcNAc-1-phosphate transferase
MFITISITPFFKWYAVKINAVDVPDERKIHEHPTPRIGGVAMVTGALIPLLCWSDMDRFLTSVLIGSTIIVVFGVWDDIKPLGYKVKFSGQVAAALIVIFYGGVQLNNPGEFFAGSKMFHMMVFIPLTFMFIIGVTNAINLSDGLDGLAGGISVLSFAGIGCLAYLCGNTAILMISVAVAGAIFGFLRFNTFPAVIFMGDAGSQVLGFLMAVLSLSLVQNNPPYSTALPLLLVGLPVLDTLTVMIKRMAAKTSPFKADNQHFHHRLLYLGFYHTEAVFCIYVFQMLIIISAVVFRFYSECNIIGLYLLFALCVTGGLIFAEKAGKGRVRDILFDNFLKRILKILKEKKFFIKASFKTIGTGIPLLLLFTAFIPAKIPMYFSYISVVLCLVVLAGGVFFKKWKSGMLRFSIYSFTPFLIFISETDMALWLNFRMERAYNLLFVVFIFLAILVLKLTQRKKGFKPTLIDFLILFIALIVPKLTIGNFAGGFMEIIAVKAIIFIFGYEVIIGELRGEINRLGLLTAAAFVVVFARGIL